MNKADHSILRNDKQPVAYGILTDDVPHVPEQVAETEVRVSMTRLNAHYFAVERLSFCRVNRQRREVIQRTGVVRPQSVITFKTYIVSQETC